MREAQAVKPQAGFDPQPATSKSTQGAVTKVLEETYLFLQVRK